MVVHVDSMPLQDRPTMQMNSDELQVLNPRIKCSDNYQILQDYLGALKHQMNNIAMSYKRFNMITESFS
jgi:hypothetical protein